MSYILDALRKSDQQRRRSGAPTLLQGQVEAAAPKQPALILYALMALVLLGAGVGIGWLRPWQELPTATAPVASGAQPSDTRRSPAPAAQAGAAPGSQPQHDVQTSAPAMQSNAVPAQPLAATPAPAPAPAKAQAQGAAATASAKADTPPRTIAPPAPAMVPAPGKVQAPSAAGATPAMPAPPPRTIAAAPKKVEPLVQDQPARGGGVVAASAPEVVAMAELPVAIQQELPPMSISVHAYSSKPGERLVGINGRLLHEGEFAAPGLKLEQVTPEGMILSYKGYTFRRGVR